MYKPKYDLSIIIPIYNVKKEYLNDCLRSITKQEINNVEVLLIDDGSDKSNNFADISGEDFQNQCAEILKKNNHPDWDIQYIINEHKGVSYARNTGLDKASGKLIYFIDADDYVYDYGLEFLVNIFNTKQCDLIIGNYGILQNGKFTRYEQIKNINNISLEQALHLACCGFSKLYKRNIIEENHLRFSTDLTVGEDWAFYSSYLLYCTKPVQCRTTCAAVYRYHDSSTTRTYDYTSPQSVLKAIKLLSEKFKQNNVMYQGITQDFLFHINKEIKNLPKYNSKIKRKSMYYLLRNAALSIETNNENALKIKEEIKNTPGWIFYSNVSAYEYKILHSVKTNISKRRFKS